LAAISQAVLDSFVPFLAPNARTLVIQNGVPLSSMRPPTPDERRSARRTLGTPEGAFIIACVGRLRPEKGHADLIRAFHEGLRDTPRAHLVIAGDGPQSGHLAALVRKLDLSARVRLLGTIDSPYELLRAADVFALASLREGFGLAVIEAMAFGLPVVATRADALPSLVANGREGLLAPPGDTRVLAEHLRAVATDDALRARLAGGVRAKDLTEWSIEHTTRSYEALYAELAAKAGCPA